MIVSSIKGRLRYRASWLKLPSSSQAFKEKLQQETAIISIEVRLQTGSVLVTYDVNQVSQTNLESLIIESALQLIPAADSSGAAHNSMAVINTTKPRWHSAKKTSKKWMKKELAGISVNQSIKYGMLGTLIPSMVWAAMGSKKIHIASGVLFLMFLAMHMYSYRERLLK